MFWLWIALAFSAGIVTAFVLSFVFFMAMLFAAQIRSG